jgi:hypothetical protein
MLSVCEPDSSVVAKTVVVWCKMLTSPVHELEKSKRGYVPRRRDAPGSSGRRLWNNQPK